MLESRGLNEMEDVCEKPQKGSGRRREINAKILQTDNVDSRRAEETRGQTLSEDKSAQLH